jgi:hypothetical protein
MSSRIFLVTALSASLLALPMLASAQGGGASTPTGTTPGTVGTTSPSSGGQQGNMSGSGMSGSGGMAGSGTMASGGFNPRNYRTPTDCLNAAAAAGAPFSACGEHRGR